MKSSWIWTFFKVILIAWIECDVNSTVIESLTLTLSGPVRDLDNRTDYRKVIQCNIATKPLTFWNRSWFTRHYSIALRHQGGTNKRVFVILLSNTAFAICLYYCSEIIFFFQQKRFSLLHSSIQSLHKPRCILMAKVQWPRLQLTRGQSHLT